MVFHWNLQAHVKTEMLTGWREEQFFLLELKRSVSWKNLGRSRQKYKGERLFLRSGAKGGVMSKGVWQGLKLEPNTLFLWSLREVLPCTMNEIQSPKSRGWVEDSMGGDPDALNPLKIVFLSFPQQKSVLFCQLWKAWFYHDAVSWLCSPSCQTCCHLGGPKLPLASSSSAPLSQTPALEGLSESF